jgi:hypothetical protein
MKYQVDATDMGTYLGTIGAKLIREGYSLQALAEIWYGKGEDNLNTIKNFGRDMIDMGEQLTVLRNQLCQNCMLKEINIFLHVGSDDSPADGNGTD